jgi:hypothetical protein
MDTNLSSLLAATWKLNLVVPKSDAAAVRVVWCSNLPA